ncbi:MAG: GtrA family protein [Calditrichaceae bacterium]|nr:GtrA family protein [Calditrichaceae bacterium]MBN2710036.1 GtrA family protein [Calditrichaceae bacterium]
MLQRIKKYVRNNILNPRTVKFAVVGLSGVLVNMGLLYILTEYAHLFYMVSSVIAIEVSILTNFFMNDLWTWKDRVKQSWIKRIIKYHSVSFGALIANWIALVILTEWFGVYYMISNLIGICLGMVINFVLNDIWTFRDSGAKDSLNKVYKKHGDVMKSLESGKIKNRMIFKISGEIVFFLVFFFYLWQWVNPELFYNQQKPVFLTGYNFLYSFLLYPGGIVEYISLLLSQYYYYSWLGAAIITITIWILTVSTKETIKQLFGTQQVYYVHFIPAFFLIIMFSDYHFPLSNVIGLLVSILTFNIYIKLKTQNTYKRSGICLLQFFLLYYISCGSALLFAALCVLYELLKNKKILLSLIYLIIAILLPYISSYYFLVTIENSYLYLTPLCENYAPLIVSYSLYLFYIIIILISSMIKLPVKKTSSDTNVTTKNHWYDYMLQIKLHRIMEPVIVIILIILTAYLSFDFKAKLPLYMDNLAWHGRWKDILKVSTNHGFDDILVTFLTNRALYHEGRLSSEMFAYPQKWGAYGLILPRQLAAELPIQRSELFLELGHINEAEHGAYEALSLKENFPRTLQQLALIYILKNEKEAAEKCLNILKRTVLFKKWAEKYWLYIENKQLILTDPVLGKIYTRMPKTDFIVSSKSPSFDLMELLKQNPDNKTAFEYLMAFFLLERQLDSFISHLEYANLMGYHTMPRHYQEAFLIYRLSGGKLTPKLAQIQISVKTIDRFKEFQKIMKTYGGQFRSAAYKLHSTHGDTYWYYLMSKKAVSR